MKRNQRSQNNKKPLRLVPEVHFSFNDHPYRRPSLVLYFCGCFHNCSGCHSKILQNPNAEICESFAVDEVVKMVYYYWKNFDGEVKDLILLGGDPVIYGSYLAELLKKLKNKIFELRVVLFTGFVMEELSEEIKNLVDIVVDGKYREDLKTGGFPSSANQRVWVKVNGKWVDETQSFLKQSKEV